MTYLSSMSKLSSLRNVNSCSCMHANNNENEDLKNQNFMITNYLDLSIFILHAINQFFYMKSQLKCQIIKQN